MVSIALTRDNEALIGLACDGSLMLTYHYILVITSLLNAYKVQSYNHVQSSKTANSSDYIL